MARAKTYEEIKQYIEIESNSGCKLLSKEYKNYATKMKFQCRCGQVFETTFGNFKATKKRQCNECGKLIKIEKRKMDINYIINYINTKKTGNGCKYISGNYINEKSKITIRCACGQVFETTFKNFRNKNKKQCDSCTKKVVKEKQAFHLEYVKKYVQDNSKCALLSTQYVGCKSKLIFKCECGSKFETTFDEFKNGGKRQCNKCGVAKMVNNNKKFYKFDYVEKVCEDKGYVLVDNEYKGCESKLTLIDKQGYKLYTKFGDILIGTVSRKIDASNPYTIDNINNHLKLNHSKYKLLSTEYKRSKDELEWKCPNGHKFKLSWDRFNSGDRCIVCNESKGEQSTRLFLDDFLYIYERQYQFRDLFGLGDSRLRFDFAIFEDKDKTKLKCLIEYDGEQHYRPVRFGNMSQEKADEELRKRQELDRKKDKYCKKNNIKLIRIPYWEFGNIEKILAKELYLDSNINNRIENIS